jgi:integrase
LAAARGKAIEARSEVEAGNDPRRTGQTAADMTFAALTDLYLADPKTVALRSRDEIERRVRRNLLPAIGALRFSDLRRRDVRNITDAMLRRGVPTEANHVFGDVRAMLRWAVANEYLTVDPLQGVEKPAAAVVRERSLSDEEVHALWHVLPAALPAVQAQRIVKLCLLTGQRIGEIARMERAELGLRAQEWRLPGSRTKNGHPHVVPLSAAALEIIQDALADAGQSAAVFPGGNPVNVGNMIRRANVAGRFGIAPWSAHDLRRTCISGMAGLGVAPIVLASVANHRSLTRAGVTLAVYSRYDYERRLISGLSGLQQSLRAMLEPWCRCGGGHEVAALHHPRGKGQIRMAQGMAST